MPWTAYKIVFRLLSPMHIGRAKMGNLQTTRPYVHGKALWGAFTARLHREFPVLAPDYERMGEMVNQDLAFGYFYPTTEEKVRLWPWDDPEYFTWLYLGSYTGTALDYDHHSAAEGTLHETEFIAPWTRTGQPVYLVGYIFQKEGSILPWKKVLSRLQLGGERTYGWGRVQQEGELQPAQDLFDYTLDLSASRPLITVPNGEPLLAHTRAVDPGAVQARGPVVPLVGRETRTAGEHGRDVVMAAVCWEPGSRVQSSVRAQIGPFGIWEAESP